jgi:hypothetical protein
MPENQTGALCTRRDELLVKNDLSFSSEVRDDRPDAAIREVATTSNTGRTNPAIAL